MSIYLGENLISGGSSKVVSLDRIGQLVTSIVPLTDSNLHLLDGAKLNGSGIYKQFVDYMADLYDNANEVSNVGIVGTLTDSNGVLSGFGSGNYADLFANFSPQENDTWEMQFKFTTPSDFSVAHTLFGNSTGIIIQSATQAAGRFYIYLTSEGSSTNYDIASSGDQTSNPILSVNTTYWFKLSFTGSAYVLKVSTDGETFTDYYSVASTKRIQQTSGTARLGIAHTGNYPFTGGTIDLNECYIKLNDNILWTGRTPAGFTDEAVWQQQVLDYGACGKFVYDSTANTVRLPKIEGFIEGTNEAAMLGELVKAGLPNITGRTSGARGDSGLNTKTGVFSGTGGSKAIGVSTLDGNYTGLDFDASLSNSIYGNSDTVQPQAIKVLYYIVVATVVNKTALDIDIDEIATDLADKADKDLENINASCKALDGQWVSTAVTLVTGATYPTSEDVVYNLGSYLPNDGYKYEVFVTGTGITGSASGNTLAIRLKTDEFNSSFFLCGSAARSNATYYSDGSVIVPVGTGRQLIVAAADTYVGTYHLYLRGYRRIGTNS